MCMESSLAFQLLGFLQLCVKYLSQSLQMTVTTENHITQLQDVLYGLSVLLVASIWGRKLAM